MSNHSAQIIDMPISTKDRKEYHRQYSKRKWQELRSDPTRLAERNANRRDYTPKGYDSRRKFLIEGGRVCTGCKVGKSWDDFRLDKQGYNNKTSRCIECIEKNRKPHKKHRLSNYPARMKRTYGITWEHVIQVLSDQHGRCGNMACGKEIFLDVPNGAARANIDHDHRNGKFRALLCVGCNTLLGKLENRPHIVDGLMTYLHKYRST